MVGPIHVATHVVSKKVFSTNITDLMFVETPDGVVLVAMSNKGGGLTSYSLSSADRRAVLVDRETPIAFGTYYSAPKLDVIERDNVQYIVVSGQQGSALSGLKMEADGRLRDFEPLFSSQQLSGDVVALNAFEMDGQDYVLAGRDGSMGLTLYRLDGDGQPVNLGTASPGPRLPVDSEYNDINVVTVGGTTYATGVSAQGNMLVLYQVGPDGLKRISQVDGSNTIGISAPREVKAVTTANGTFLIVTGGESDSLTVFQLTEQGEMRLTDHVVDSATTRFQAATAIASVEVDGRAFVFAGGADDGIAVLTLDGQGRLILLATLTDYDGIALADISAIEARVFGDKIAIFVASATETGISQFSFDPGNIGVSHAGKGRLNGTGEGDILIGTGASSMLSGGAGDDILIAREGVVHLLGGSGADLFIPGYGTTEVTIHDFDPRADRIDLSELSYIRSIAQMQIIPSATGAMLAAGRIRIDIRTVDGTALQASDFTEFMFRLAHYANDIDFSQLVDPVVPDPGTPVPGRPGGGGRDPGKYTPAEPLPPLAPMDDIQSGTAGDDRMLGYGHARVNIRSLGGNDVIIGSRGQDNLFGGAGHDSIYGGDSSDNIQGNEGSDSIVGQAGHDRISGGSGNDHIAGSAGDDRIWGDDGQDSIYGEAGHDVIYGGAGGDMLGGGPGDDLIYGGGGRDTINGGGGHDRLFGEGDFNRIFAGGGNDLIDAKGKENVLNGGGGADTVYGGPARDYIFLSDGDDLSEGRQGDDFIIGNAGDDMIYGNDGDDHVIGHIGDDQLWGGNGNDILWGFTENDLIFGEAGNDSMRGGDGNDTLHGGPGDDYMWGGADNDLMLGHDGAEYIWGQKGRDTLDGGAGADTMNGGGGNDLLRGGDGDDNLHGSLDDDIVQGDAGADTLRGGGGNDTLSGGAGADLLIGGVGADVFVFTPQDCGVSGRDRIADFQQGADSIDLSQVSDSLIWMGGAAFTGAGRAEVQVRENPDAIQLAVDVDGDGKGDLFVDIAGGDVGPFDFLF
ncbi:MAG: M10 family metallopeptidase C-terminal domain-containing protein [Paracoccus sp. (in: a-proteobacteria)]